MAINTLVPPSVASASAAIDERAAFNERWAAWQSRGVAHDRTTNRRMAIAAPVLLMIAAIVYMVVGR
jgi:hypothetical protein